MASAIATSVALAGVSFLLNSVLEREKAQREARLARVSDQLRLFFGPLLATLSASKSAYVAMLHHVSPDQTAETLKRVLDDTHDPQHEKVSTLYRHWLRTVLQPLNERASATVEAGFHLLDTTTGVPVHLLLDLVAHTSAMRALLDSSSYHSNASDVKSARTANEVPTSVPDVVASAGGRHAFDAALENAGTSFEKPKPFMRALTKLENSPTTSGVSFPDELIEFVEREFQRLMRVNQRALNIPSHDETKLVPARSKL